jgi:predicted alpha/beta superfamily hydrolase
MIDKEYRTYPNRQCTGIAGSSMGGLMAMFGVIKYNDVFSKAACVSSAIGFCMPKLNEDIAAYPIDPDTRAFISWGTREAWGVKDHEHEDTSSPTARNNHEVADKLAAQGAAIDVFCDIGGSHCEADWRHQVPRFMDFLWMR